MLTIMPKGALLTYNFVWILNVYNMGYNAFPCFSRSYLFKMKKAANVILLSLKASLETLHALYRYKGCKISTIFSSSTGDPSLLILRKHSTLSIFPFFDLITTEASVSFPLRCKIHSDLSPYSVFSLFAFDIRRFAHRCILMRSITTAILPFEYPLKWRFPCTLFS